jgi:hypothetical protein
MNLTDAELEEGQAILEDVLTQTGTKS